MRQSYRFVVTGRVQGVWFRQSTRQRAEELGLHGWVKNRTDGAVEGVACGEDIAALERLREWLNHGPQKARVESLSWDRCQNSIAVGFEVRD